MLGCFAQKKFEYCDVYARGGWNNLKITIIYDEIRLQTIGGNIGGVLNELAKDGWVLDDSIVIPRRGFYVTRHKIHFIMKREITNQSLKSECDSGQIPAQKLKAKQKPARKLKAKQKPTQKLKAKQINELRDEILLHIEAASSYQDMEKVKKQIVDLDSYAKKLWPKDFSAIDAVNEVKWQYNKKAKRFGVLKM